MRTTLILAAVAAILLTEGTANGQAPPPEPGLGPEFLVNTYTPDLQEDASVACDATGNFVVVWDSQFGNPNYRNIQGQRFDALGSPLGGEFQINTYTPGEQNSPRVARRGDGQFVVAWEGLGPGSYSGVTSRRFSTDGNPLADESALLINAGRPAVAGNEDGYVVAWRQFSLNPTEIQGRRFDWTGSPVGSVFTAGLGNNPAEVAIDTTGRFVVTWADVEIRARVYDAGGAPLGPDFQVNSYITGSQRYPSVAMADDGSFVVVWQNEVGYLTEPIRGQRFDAAANPVGSELTLSPGASLLPSIAHRPAGGYVVAWWGSVTGHRFDDAMTPVGDYFLLSEEDNAHSPRLAANNGRQTVFVWTSIGQPPDSSLGGIFARRGGFPDWAPFTADERASGGTSNVNGVIETGERAVVDPAYLNLSGFPYPLAGTASNFTGPAGPVYTIHDASADYGVVSPSAPTSSSPSGGTTGECFAASGNCFEFEVTGARPQAHWDATYDEALSEGVSMTRTLHVGGSFADVPGTNIFVKFIENLFHNAITAGGPCGGYCPTDGVKRQQMAVFLLKSKNGSTYVPPSATGTVFADVPQSNIFAAWIEDLYNQGVTGGCGSNPLVYCPDAIVNRQQMAVFLLKMKEGSAYDPPDCADLFQDVPCTPGAGFSDWIEELYNRQITGGCQLTPLLYCPTNQVTRGQMAAFLVKNFGLVLYGP